MNDFEINFWINTKAVPKALFMSSTVLPYRKIFVMLPSEKTIYSMYFWADVTIKFFLNSAYFQLPLYHFGRFKCYINTNFDCMQQARRNTGKRSIHRKIIIGKGIVSSNSINQKRISIFVQKKKKNIFNFIV